MDTKNIQRAFGILSFLTAMVVYLMTVQPTVPFWDCGEFSSAAIWQQVPHPPGAPLFLMIGKMFHLLIPFGDEGWRINLASVFASAVTVWLLYLITVMVIKNFRKDPISSWADAFAVYGSGYVAAAALIFSDTFWFNAVESEVYAMSSLFVAVVVYLMMKWNENADKPGHERYLLLIAYLMGLSTGVHLLALLAIFSIVFLVYFRKYKFSIGTFIVTGIIAVVVFSVIYPVVVKWIPSMLAGHMPFKNKCQEYTLENPLTGIFVFAAIIAAAVGLWWGLKNKMSILNLICSAFLLMILGYTTYTHILIRSNANPPMNENEPKTLSGLTSYLGREQYGDAPNWPRRYNATDDYYISRYEKRDAKGEYVYGMWPRPSREVAECNDGRAISVPKFTDINTPGEFNYLWKYQIDHMYIRYFLWNYVGRLSDTQDAGVYSFNKKEIELLNFESGYANLFPVSFFALPLILGLIGLFFHFNKDPKMAFIYLMMFLMMGVMTAIAQNQQEPQPRERDYFYAGSFFVFCLWIGMSVYSIIDWIWKEKFNFAGAAGIFLGVTLLAPFNMAIGGWKFHSRAGNYLPFDYSYNILQSVEKDAILFTNGDNDTFPLWFLQDVSGVRRDVRIVNLSLGNTLWYIDQLKNREPWGATKLPLSFSDDSLRVSESDPGALSYDFGQAFDITIPVKKDILARYTSDSTIINSGQTKFTFIGKPYGENEGKPLYLYRVQDKLILNILQNVKYERPVYFSVTVGGDAFCGLDNFFRYEGMAMRVCPVPQRNTSGDAIEPEIMEKCLMNIDNSDNYSKTQKYGFKLRNLNNHSVYYDEVHRRLMLTYRTLYLNYANNLLMNGKDTAKAIAAIDLMNKYISPTQFPISFEMEFLIAKAYYDAGAKDRFKPTAERAIKASMQLIENQDLKPDLLYYEITGRYWGPYRRAANLHELLGNYTAAKQILERFQGVLTQAQASYSQMDGYSEDLSRVQNNLLDVQTNIDEMTILETKATKGTDAAIQLAKELIQSYLNSQNQIKQRQVIYLQKRVTELGGKLDTAVINPIQ